jgi:small subunit ribosomal protein S6
MAHDPPVYDLMLLLATSAPDEQREKILADVKSAIGAGGGTVLRDDQWGTRPLTYRIDHQGEAEYHLLQLTGPPALLDSLSHSLRIADTVLRFRVIKVRPGTPAPPSSPPPVIAPVAAPVVASAPLRPSRLRLRLQLQLRLRLRLRPRAEGHIQCRGAVSAAPTAGGRRRRIRVATALSRLETIQLTTGNDSAHFRARAVVAA